MTEIQKTLDEIREEKRQKSSLKQKSLLDFYEKTIKYIKIDDIEIHERIRYSLNELQINRLSESISQIGLINPITVSKNRKLVAGNHRLHACKKLGWDKIPCVITTIDDSLLLELQEIDENLIRYELHYIDRGNHLKRRKEIYEELYPETKKGMKGGWYNNKTKKLEKAHGAVSRSFIQDTSQETGIAERTIAEDIQIVENIEPELQKKIKENKITKKDAIKLARLKDTEKQKKVIKKIKKKKAKKISEAINQVKHEEKVQNLKKKGKEEKGLKGKILDGDFFDKIHEISNNSIDLLFVDPPYNVLDQEWDSFDNIENFMEFTESWLTLVISKVKESGRIYICFSQRYQFELYNLLKKHDFYGFNFGRIIIWNYKNNNKHSNRKEYRYSYDPIFYLYGPNAIELNFPPETYGETQNDVWNITTPQSNFKEGKYNKAQKPLELLKRIIITGSKENDLILDPFAGSGTTGVISEKLNRKYILIEKNPEDIEIIKGRLNSLEVEA